MFTGTHSTEWVSQVLQSQAARGRENSHKKQTGTPSTEPGPCGGGKQSPETGPAFHSCRSRDRLASPLPWRN